MGAALRLLVTLTRHVTRPLLGGKQTFRPVSKRVMFAKRLQSGRVDLCSERGQSTKYLKYWRRERDEDFVAVPGLGASEGLSVPPAARAKT